MHYTSRVYRYTLYIYIYIYICLGIPPTLRPGLNGWPLEATCCECALNSVLLLLSLVVVVVVVVVFVLSLLLLTLFVPHAGGCSRGGCNRGTF